MARVQDRGDRRKAKKITIPGMAGVEGRTLVAEGEWLVSVKEVTQEDGANYPYLKWVVSVQAEGTKEHGAALFQNTSLAPQALWNLRAFLEALGAEIPDDDMDIDPDDFVGMTCMVSVEHDTYEGKKQAKIVDFWPTEITTKDEERGAKKSTKEVDEDASQRSRRSRDKDEDEAQGSRRDKVKEVEPDDDDEPKEDKNKARRDRRAERKAGKKSSLPKLNQDDLADMSQDELEDVAEKYGFDIDFTDLPTLRKMRNAVIDAAEAKDLLEE